MSVFMLYFPFTSRAVTLDRVRSTLSAVKGHNSQRDRPLIKKLEFKHMSGNLGSAAQVSSSNLLSTPGFQLFYNMTTFTVQSSIMVELIVICHLRAS